MKQMNEALKHRIEVHRQDFESVEIVPFKHFYCPLLHLDENVPLQKGHVVNQSLNDAASDWVVQRQDIDGWYGTHFEADFKKVQDRQRILDRPSDLLTDPRLNKDHRPILMVGGARVEHTPKELPKEAPFVRFGIRHGDEVSHTNIKVALGELDNVMKQSWEVVYGNRSHPGE